MRAGVALAILIASCGSARSETGAVLVIPGRAGVPIIINGVDASYAVDEGDWGLAPFAAHQFGLLTHFVTLSGAGRELDRHGFDLEAAFPRGGEAGMSPDSGPISVLKPKKSLNSPR